MPFYMREISCWRDRERGEDDKTLYKHFCCLLVVPIMNLSKFLEFPCLSLLHRSFEYMNKIGQVMKVKREGQMEKKKSNISP